MIRKDTIPSLVVYGQIQDIFRDTKRALICVSIHVSAGRLSDLRHADNEDFTAGCTGDLRNYPSDHPAASMACERRINREKIAILHSTRAARECVKICDFLIAGLVPTVPAP